jgi:hypothetical protein
MPATSVARRKSKMIRKFLWRVLLSSVFLVGCTAPLSFIGGDVTATADETSGVIVNGIPSLTVNHFAGTITVHDGEAGKITANLTKQSRIADEAEARAQLDQIVMTFTQNGTDVVLDVDVPDSFAELAQGPTGDLELLVPPGTILDLNLGAGEITVEQPSGDVEVNSGAGTVTVVLPADASFRLMVTGGVATVRSEFEGVPGGGPAAAIDTTVGSNPTQTLTFNLGAGEVILQKAE